MDNLDKNDYTDPVCPFCFDAYKKGPIVDRIPIDRVMQKLDEYFSRNDIIGAEKHLKYWFDEAKRGNDDRGMFAIHNEMMGFYRKQGNKEEALLHAYAALQLIEEMNLTDSITNGTALLNAATVHKAFGESEKAIPLFEKSKSIYEKELKPFDSRLGGLYNNMGLAMIDVEKYDEAESLYYDAIKVMENVENGQTEQAITYLNIADMWELKLGSEQAEEKVKPCIEKALELLNTETLPKDGNYAYVCEKCSEVLKYYGYFFDAQDLKKRADAIYDRT